MSGQGLVLQAANGPTDGTVNIPWAGSLVGLGARLARMRKSSNEAQTIVVITLPQRNLAASLIACGWILTSSDTKSLVQLDKLNELVVGRDIRLSTDKYLVSGRLNAVELDGPDPRLRVGPSAWKIEKVTAVSQAPDGVPSTKIEIPPVNDLAEMAGWGLDWSQRLVCGNPEVLIVGTLKWLEEDLDVCWRRSTSTLTQRPMRQIVMPRSEECPSSFLDAKSAAVLAEELPLDDELDLVILDGAPAIRYLNEITSPTVVCIIDRSMADETAQESILQRRNTRGQPFSVREELKWPVPVEFEALGFKVPL